MTPQPPLSRTGLRRAYTDSGVTPLAIASLMTSMTGMRSATESMTKCTPAAGGAGGGEEEERAVRDKWGDAR